MAGNTRWIRDASGKEHPDDSSLLAYACGQYLEDQRAIDEHIEQCLHCRRKHNKFVDTSALLGVLEHEQARLVYTDMPPALDPASTG